MTNLNPKLLIASFIVSDHLYMHADTNQMIILVLLLITKKTLLCQININFFISDNVAEGDVYKSDLPEHVLDQHPTIEELITHARTGKWNELGAKLKLDSVNLEGCNDYTSMYQLWIMEKGREATRRNLLKALHVIKQQNVLENYEDYLRKLLVDTI